MATDSDFIRYTAQVARLLGRFLMPDVTLPAFPDAAPVPVAPAPVEPPPISWTGASGITLHNVYPTSQPRRFRVYPDQYFRFEGGIAREGQVADSMDYWNAGMDYHDRAIGIAPGEIDPNLGESFVIAVAQPRTDNVCLREAVLVECRAPQPTISLGSFWPSLLTGARSADVQEFLDSTSWYPETKEGWAGRLGHAYLNVTPSDEPGYGGKIAERTSFGALLLASTLSASEKAKIQERMLLLADADYQAGITYPADGGHGIGRYFPSMMRRALAVGPTRPDTDFSEVQQIVPYAGPDNFGGYGWRHHGTDPVTMGSDYVTACSANRWAGAALVAGLLPTTFSPDPTTFSPDLAWIEFTRAYLRKATMLVNFPAWEIVKHDRSRELILANRDALGF